MEILSIPNKLIYKGLKFMEPWSLLPKIATFTLACLSPSRQKSNFMGPWGQKDDELLSCGFKLLLKGGYT